ncbi:hypothetical protein BJV82DRAFT_583334 [Fennellomyces sp. T-0311]|nr:hypothetical protein BJV82DRAFT_583334 [Fennellomyces sp. T-0311]
MARQNVTEFKRTRRLITPPPFKGTLAEEPHAWVIVFDKAQKYHEWTDEEAAVEFMVLMHGPAIYWWGGLTTDTQSSYCVFKEAFKAYFGEDDNTARAVLYPT